MLDRERARRSRARSGRRRGKWRQREHEQQRRRRGQRRRFEQHFCQRRDGWACRCRLQQWSLEGDEACDDGNDDEDDARSKNCEITQFDVEYDQTLSNEWPGIGTSGVDGGKGFFVVWRWLGPSSEIRGRAYTRSGERVTDAAVKLSTSAQPGQARIGTNPEGRSIVTWQGDGYAVRYRVVDPNGTPQGASDLTLLQLADLAHPGERCGKQFGRVRPRVARARRDDRHHQRLRESFDASGSPGSTATNNLGPATSGDYPGAWGIADGFVASWSTSTGNLASWKLDPQGMPQTPPGQFNLASGRNAFGAYVGPGDEFIAVFESDLDLDGQMKTRIFKRFFTAPGMSAEVPSVVSSVHRAEFHSRVERHTNGRFLVVWSEGEYLPGNLDNYCRIVARIFQPNGQALGISVPRART